jgi:hypothetical protein
MAIAFSILASSMGGMSSAGPSSPLPGETLEKIDIWRFSLIRLHCGQ